MLDNLNTKQKKIIGVIGIAILIALCAFFYTKSNNNTIDVNDDILIQNNYTEENKSNEEIQNMIIVHITGAVKTPGVVKLQEGSRMEDAIEAARRIN